MSQPPPLPRIARWILAAIPLGDRRSDVESDLAELYDIRTQQLGWGRASVRLTLDILSLLTPVSRASSVFQDAQFGLRLIRKHPAPIGITVGGLALAIAIVTATFGVINAALLRPFKMDDPSSVVTINRPGPRASSSWPFVEFRHWQERLRLTTVEATLLDTTRFSLSVTGDDARPEYVRFVSGGYLRLLGGRARIGRTLDASDDRAGAPLVAVATHTFWTTYLQSDESVVGRTIWLGDTAVTIVGVMDPDFRGPTTSPSAFWVPLASYDDLTHGRAFTPISNELIDVVGRLTPGASIATAQNELTAVSPGMVTWQGAPDSTARAARVVSARSPWDARDIEEEYGALAVLGIASLVLILACANAANLLLAGATLRMREMGVRLALGATRRRLIRQLVTESVLLGLISGAFGFLLSIWFMRIGAVLASLPPDLSVTPDLRVLLFATGVGIASGIGAGLLPARYGAGGDVLTALKMQRGQTRRWSGRSTLRVSFVGAQAAVSIFFLVAAGLLTRSALHVSGTALGFDADRLLAVSLDIPRSAANYDRTIGAYNDNARAYLQAAVATVRGLPGVEDVAVSLYPPFGFSRSTTRSFSHDGRSYNVFGSQSDAAYFRTAGFRILRGRSFTEEEAASGAPVALISSSVARDFFGGIDPIGRTMTGVRSPFGHEAVTTVIGIVDDAMPFRPDTERYGIIYAPMGSHFSNPPTLIVRSAHPEAMAHTVELALLALNPGIRLGSRAIGAAAERTFANQRSMAMMSGAVALVAFALALLGVYGVTSFAVSQRSQEVGVRMAMGASAGDIVALLVRQSLRPVVIGLVSGLAVVLLASQVLASTLSGVGPRDPIAIAGATATLLFGAYLAVISPARRAARVAPASVLRQG